MILNIIVDECWRCKNDFLVAYLDDEENIPVGPSYFSDKQIELAKKEGVKIEMVHSKTINEDYEACVCPHCGSFLGEFFYHDFTYIDGNIQIYINEDDEVIKKKINKPIVMKESSGFDIDKDNERLKNEKEENKKYLERSARNFKYKGYNSVRVKFENGKNYPYNCPFDAEVGDIVYVEGKLQGVKGRIVKIEGKWKSYKTMQEVIKIEKIHR